MLRPTESTVLLCLISPFSLQFPNENLPKRSWSSGKSWNHLLASFQPQTLNSCLITFTVSEMKFLIELLLIKQWTFRSGFKGSTTHLQALQISMKFLLQIAYDISIILVKFLTHCLLAIRNKYVPNVTHSIRKFSVEPMPAAWCTLKSNGTWLHAM